MSRLYYQNGSFASFSNLHSWSGDGADEYCYHSIANYRSGDTQGSICAWIKTTNSDGRIWASADEAGINANFISIQISANTFRARTGALNTLEYNTTLINDGTWHHVILVSTGSAYKIYIDGLPVAFSMISGSDNGNWFSSLPTQRDNITIGSLRRASAGDLFGGNVANVGVFSVGFSDAEALEAYNLKMGDLRTHSQGGNLVGAWYFQNGQADYPMYYDYSGAGNNLTMINQESSDISSDIP